MPEAKTVPNDRSVADFLAAVEPDERRIDAESLCRLMAETTGEAPVLWGPSIVGFGSRHYRYASGREGDWPRVGFSPRKRALKLYLSGDLAGFQELLGRLGKYKTGVGCLYLKRLADVDVAVLHDIVLRSYAPSPGSDAQPE